LDELTGNMSELIDSAWSQIKATEGLGCLYSRWSQVKFHPSSNIGRMMTDDALLGPVKEDGEVNIYVNDSLDNDKAKNAAIREFGRFIFSQAHESLQRRWVYKFAVPALNHVKKFQDCLSATGYKTYREIVESSNDPVERLVFLNLANGLLANNFVLADSHNVNVITCPATEAYANCRKYHTLIPLTTAYASREINEDFGVAFVECTNGFKNVTHSSVARELKLIVLDVAKSSV